MVWLFKGVYLILDFVGLNCEVSVYYEWYDGILVYSKWLSVKNIGKDFLLIDSFISEVLVVVEYGLVVEIWEYGIVLFNIYVEIDYVFVSFNVEDVNYYVVYWELDFDYNS